MLPKERVAIYPAERRDDSRLMLLRKEESFNALDYYFKDLPSLLSEGDALVLNETKVKPLRIFGTADNGTNVELLIAEYSKAGQAKALVKGLKKLKKGMLVNFGDGLSGEFLHRDNVFGVFSFNIKEEPLERWLKKNGHTPLPPYINRNDEELDKERYQTIFAKNGTSCAAPTAGLHFTEKLFKELNAKGVKIHKISLHVGPGTFRPVTSNDITKHKLDEEEADVPEELFRKLMKTKSKGGRVIAVGTTTTRALETTARNGGSFRGKTGLFIYPGFEFKIIDGLITNFHLPESSLLMLVSALAGRKNVLKAYEEAVRKEYRFYSYGDAMLII